MTEDDVLLAKVKPFMHQPICFRSSPATLVGLMLVLCLGRFADAGAQSLRWTAHTPFQSVSAIAASSNALWAATSGGVFSYDPETGEFGRFTPVEGLNSVDTQALEYDGRREAVWVGYQDGVLDRIDLETGDVRSFRDIERAEQFALRRINRIRAIGDSLFVATTFGLVIFDPDRNEVRDTYSRLGDLPAATAVNDFLIAPVPSGETGIWLATDEGVAFASLKAANLQDPAAWTIEKQGLPGGNPATTAISLFRSSVYVGTPTDLYIRNNGQYMPVGISLNGVTDLLNSGGRMFGARRFNLFVVEADGTPRGLNVPGFEAPVSLAVDATGDLWFGDGELGIVDVGMPGPSETDLTVAANVFPPGPTGGIFVDMVFDDAGNLWAGEASTFNSGFSRLDNDGRWTTFSSRTNPELSGKGRFTRIHVDGDGDAWITSEGGGVVEVFPDDRLTLFDNTNSSLLPASGTSFIIAGGVDGDADGNLWFTTRGSSRPLHVRQPDGTWTALPPLIGAGLGSSATAYDRILIDSFGEKWIQVRNERDFNLSRGLAILDTGGTPTDPSDDIFRFLSQKGGAGRGLPSVQISTVTEDREGQIWIGTDSGPAFMINTGIVAQESGNIPNWPTWADRSLGTFVLFGLKINDIAVDPANRLWMATNEGAWLIERQEEGYGLVEHLTTDNTPLFSDNVISIAVNERTGEVYFATDRGLISREGDAVAPARKAGNLFVYPNPVVLGDGNQADITIDGLVEETDIRIVAIHGELVAKLSARGGRVRWDGRDLNNRLVPSGVYLVVAVGQNNEGAAYGKVAIIR